ncbi:pyrroloquinoline-quinone synthase PqqC [Acidiphilium sp.]|uniref:pyrroloquinoline-quinone synthase PqqC n=1 Tax=Acidiphilium sp. TaxID=527 RepID=UPI003D043F5B
MTVLMSADELEAELRALGAARYHNRHPFHQLLHGGALNRRQVQAWALNRYCYQAAIPIKDASLIARAEDADLRRVWRQRLIDHDGSAAGEGGIAKWLALTDGLGLDRDMVTARTRALPATRFAVQAYIDFVRDRPLLEAVASSLTEMFSPTIISERVAGMLAGYRFITKDTLAYFNARLDQAPRDADFALDYVKRHARTPEQQRAVIAALGFKCDVLWAQLDALHHAYVLPGMIPPGAFGHGGVWS